LIVNKFVDKFTTVTGNTSTLLTVEYSCCPVTYSSNAISICTELTVDSSSTSAPVAISAFPPASILTLSIFIAIKFVFISTTTSPVIVSSPKLTINKFVDKLILASPAKDKSPVIAIIKFVEAYTLASVRIVTLDIAVLACTPVTSTA
jgi:hypothetical protein